MTNPPVEVIEIKEDNMQALADMNFSLTAFLDAELPHAKIGRPDELLNACLRDYAAKSTTIFFLAWRGSKIPRGAVIRGKVVAWTQNGIVSAEGGETIGTYARLVEFGPKNEQQMVVYYIGKALPG